MQLYHDKPVSPGVENALKRARQMVEFPWTPIRRIPSGHIFRTPTEKKYVDMWLPPHFPQQGMIYSSVRLHCKFVGSNVSFETYVTALANPGSVLYTRPQHGLGRSMFSYYGTVCSAFASYVCQLPYPMACAGWGSMEGVSPVDSSRLENLQLCDLLLSEGHIAVVTDILRDTNGNVCRISVSESMTPVCRCTEFTPQQFRGYWLEDGYTVYRYAGIHNVTYTPSPYVPLEGDPPSEVPPHNTTFMADFGNKANYCLGETVEFSIFESGWETMEITGPDGISEVLSIAGETVAYTPAAPGYYTAVCRKGSTISQSVEFCATRMILKLAKNTFSQQEPIRLKFDNAIPGDTVFYAQVNSHDLFYRLGRSLTPEEIAGGRAVIAHNLAPGQYVVEIVAQNAYGKYIARSELFTIE